MLFQIVEVIYVGFYDQYLASMADGDGTPYSDGGQVETALKNLGMHVRTRVLDYTTVVPADRPELLESYLQRCAFDDTFGRNSRAAEALPLLSRGWSIGLDGVREGSRVLLQVPPALSQTPRGRPPFIPEFTTVWFVIDVVAVHNVFP